MFRCAQYNLLTKKPVPQHHSLVDFTGCYVTPDAALASLIFEFRNYSKITILDVLYKLQYMKFFAPLQMVVD